jgi:iron complex outermembrane receptor protein
LEYSTRRKDLLHEWGDRVTYKDAFRCVKRCAGAALLLLLTAHARAQSIVQNGWSGDALAEVVVTAQKRSEDLQVVPAQVNVISAAHLDELHATQLTDIGAYIPGLQVNSAGTPGQTTLSLRGIAPIGPSATVGSYVDDTPVGSTSIQAAGAFYSLDLMPYDVERIEVLQGPQGTLYGANSIGGLVKYVLTSPNLTDFQGRVGFDVFGVHNASAPGGGARVNITGPIIPGQLGFLASYASEDTPGYINNSQTGQKDQNGIRQQSGRLALLWEPVDTLSVKVGALFQRVDASGNASVAVDPVTLRPIAGDLTDNNYVAQPSRNTLQHYSAEINWDVDWARFVSASSYSDSKFTRTQDLSRSYADLFALVGAPPGIAPFYAHLETRKVTQEFRLSSPTTKTVEWLIGGFFTHEDTENDQTINAQFTDGTAVPGLDPLLIASLPDLYKEYAVFGDVTIHVTDKFDVAGGVRYAKNKQSFPVTATGSLTGTASLFGTSSEGVTTYSFSPRYQITQDFMTYLRIASGYQAGGPNIPYPGVPPTVKSDTLTNFEAGFKSEFWEKRAMLDIAAFYVKWHDVQVQGFQPGTGFTYLDNGGTASSQGVSLDGSIRPIAGFTLSGNVTYTNAKLTQDVPEISGLNGDRLPYIPQWSGAAQADYSWTLTNDLSAKVGAGLRVVGNRFSNVSSNPYAFEFKSYEAVDLNAALTFRDYTARLFVKNAGDTRAYNFDALIQDALTTQSIQTERTVIQPRTVGIAVDVKF